MAGLARHRTAGTAGRPPCPSSHQIKHLDVKRYAVPMGRLADEERAGAASASAADGEPRDEVDELVAAWRAQRPDLDVEPMQGLGRVPRLAGHRGLPGAG